MSTLTIQLPDDLASRLERVSAERHVAPSQVVSECLAKSLPAPAGNAASALEGLHDLVGCVDGGVTDLATNPVHLEGFGQWRR